MACVLEMQCKAKCLEQLGLKSDDTNDPRPLLSHVPYDNKNSKFIRYTDNIMVCGRCGLFRYSLMLQCWNHSPKLRPTFFDIVFKLDRILVSSGSEVSLPVAGVCTVSIIYRKIEIVAIFYSISKTSRLRFCSCNVRASDSQRVTLFSEVGPTFVRLK